MLNTKLTYNQHPLSDSSPHYDDEVRERKGNWDYEFEMRVTLPSLQEHAVLGFRLDYQLEQFRITEDRPYKTRF